MNTIHEPLFRNNSVLLSRYSTLVLNDSMTEQEREKLIKSENIPILRIVELSFAAGCVVQMRVAYTVDVYLGKDGAH